MSRSIIYYVAIAAIFIILKLCYIMAGNEQLQFLLLPTSKVIGAVTNASASFDGNTGYYHAGLNIVIDKSCSGYNFWLICFVMLAVAAVPGFSKPFYAINGIATILFVSYLLTCVVNIARILVALQVKKQWPSLGTEQERIIHEAEGVFVYVASLIMIYLLFQYLKKRSKLHAKPA